RLWDERPPRWLRPIRSAMQPRMQLLEVVLQVARVLLPRHSLDPGGRLSLQGMERGSKSIEAQVVKERRELHLLVLSCCLSYTFQRTLHAGPALCPGRVLLVRVPLDR